MFQDSKFVYMVNKFPVGGELFAHLASAGFFSEEVQHPEHLFAGTRSNRDFCFWIFL
jgi:hypothetical protein